MAVELVTLAAARTRLRVTGTDLDAEITTVLQAASELCERETGLVWDQRSIVETHSGGAGYIQLLRGPVTSITSVVESGVSLSSTAGVDWVLDADAGLLHRGSESSALTWRAGRRNIDVTYVAGPAAADVPSRIVEGVLVLVQHLWETRRGASGLPRQAGGATEWDPRQGYAIPRRALELWGESLGGIA